MKKNKKKHHYTFDGATAVCGAVTTFINVADVVGSLRDKDLMETYLFMSKDEMIRAWGKQTCHRCIRIFRDEVGHP